MRTAILLALASLACTGSDKVRPAFDYKGPKGDVGPMGPQGPKGDTGPAGATGPAGPQGELGIAGMVGLTGPQGDAGPIGIMGLTGPQGPIGPAGLNGNAGPQGLQGPKGDKGDIGPKGDKGATGIDGESPTITPEPAGDNCTNSGLKIELKGNSYYICNGIALKGNLLYPGFTHMDHMYLWNGNWPSAEELYSSTFKLEVWHRHLGWAQIRPCTISSKTIGLLPEVKDYCYSIMSSYSATPANRGIRVYGINDSLTIDSLMLNGESKQSFFTGSTYSTYTQVRPYNMAFRWST